MADYVIKQGDTLSAIAQANKTTVDALAKANQIADPNKIIAGATLRLPGADINASEIKEGAPEITPPLEPAKDATNANAVLEYTQKEQERINKEKQAAQASMGTTAGGYAGLIEEAGGRPTINTETKRTQEMAESGATEKGKELDLQTIKTATIKGEIDGLKLSEQTEIDNLEKSGVTRGAIDREKEVIQRKYASQLAKKTSQFNIEAAMLSAMEGNYSRAKGLADEAVQDYTYDYQQNVKTFDTLFSLHADWISQLDKDEQNVLKTAANEAQNELDKVTEEKKGVSDLMVKYNQSGAGITMDDTLESATEKASKIQATPDIIGSADTGYFQWDSKTGNWKTTGIGGGVSPTQKAINSDVAEFILKLDGGNIGWGAAFDAMKALHPELSNEKIDQLLGKEKRYEYQPSSGDLSQWEVESVIWKWLSGDGSGLSNQEKKQRIMSSGLNPETFGIY